MQVDLDGKLVDPREMVCSRFRADLVLASLSVYFAELIVPWEDSVEEACERKTLGNAWGQKQSSEDGESGFVHWR